MLVSDAYRMPGAWKSCPHWLDSSLSFLSKPLRDRQTPGRARESQGGKKDGDSWRLSEPALPAVTGQGEHRYLACIREVKQEEHILSTSREETQLLSLVCVPSTASWKVGPPQMTITSGEGACIRPAVRVRLVKGSLPTSPHEA